MVFGIFEVFPWDVLLTRMPEGIDTLEDCICSNDVFDRAKSCVNKEEDDAVTV